MSQRKRQRELGFPELTAISLGGMIGGGIFSILGLAAEQIGNSAPVGIMIGAVLALFAAYPYVQLARYYCDEGATYAFVKRTYPGSRFFAAAVGWLVVFGYVCTLALYAFTFASYAASVIPGANGSLWHFGLASAIVVALTALNLASVRWTGRVEDLLVYAKLGALVIVGVVLLSQGESARAWPLNDAAPFDVVTIAALTFVAFEGFQLAIHASEEVDDPGRNVPRAIYTSVSIAGAVYVLIAIGAIMTAPISIIVRDKEFALASAAESSLGGGGHALVLGGALLATASAITGTLFGASRLMAVIADDGYMPAFLRRRIHGHTPSAALLCMAATALAIVAAGGLTVIVEFGSLTFIIVSLLIAIANLRVGEKAGSRAWISWICAGGLATGALLLLAFQARHDPLHLATSGVSMVGIGIAAAVYARG